MPMPPSFMPIRYLIPWPEHLLRPVESGEELGFLDLVGITDFTFYDRPTGESVVRAQIGLLDEAGFQIPGLDGFSVVFGAPDDAVAGGPGAEFDVEVELGLPLAVKLLDVGITLRMKQQLLKPVELDADGKWVPSLGSDGEPRPFEISLTGLDVGIDGDGDFDLSFPQGAPGITIDAFMISDSGIVVEADQPIQVYLSRKLAPPPGKDQGFRGVHIPHAKIHLPEMNFSSSPVGLEFTDCFIGSGGFSGNVAADLSLSGELFGIAFVLQHVDLTFDQSIPVASDIRGLLTLPFFDEPVEVEIGIDVGGGFSVKLASTGQNGLYKLTKPGVLELELDSIGFEVNDGLFIAKLSGGLTPLIGKEQGLVWPTFKVEELSIDSKGHVKLQGGWLALREQYTLDFHKFHIGISAIGFGQTDDGGKWVGFSGEVKLVDGFKAGASVEGLRVTWYEDGRDAKVSFNGIGVEFEVPEVFYFKGSVSYREMEVAGETIHRFDGDIKLELISLKLKIDAKLVLGSASGPQGSYNFFAIYLGVELPTGIPLTPTPLALFGMAGLVALQMEPGKLEDEEWYDGWYKKPEIGVTDLKSKWVNRRGSKAFGVGVTVGTSSDNGFTISCKALLVIVFPGPIIMIEGMANLLKERAALDDNPMFRSLAVIDGRKGEILIGLDARYLSDEKDGSVIDIRASVEAYFHSPSDWHIYIGQKEPREKRIRAGILKLFEANSYLMIDAKALATGAWVGFAKNWQFGPVGLSLEAWIEFNVLVNWTPLHFHGDLWLHGGFDIRVFGFEISLMVDARFAADVFDPYHVVASLSVSVKLPRPLKSKSFEMMIEWGPRPDWPKHLPLPLKEVAIEHFKVTTSWPLSKDAALLQPSYDQEFAGLRSSDINYTPAAKPEPLSSAMPVVPLDCRPHVSFGRPVHDDALVGVNPQPVVPEYERIGDPEKNEGPARVRYGLTMIELSKKDSQTQAWTTVAVAGRAPVNRERALYGSWAPVPQLPSGAGQAPATNVKLWLWSKTPFDHTLHGGSDWDDWFMTKNPNRGIYPCIDENVPSREFCFDFERLDRTIPLVSPWIVPEHPEITLVWGSPERRLVRLLDPPVDGYTRALCFPAFAPAATVGAATTAVVNRGIPGAIAGALAPNTLSIRLATPAKRVRVTIVEPTKPDRTCLDFRNRPVGDVQLPLSDRGVTIGTGGGTSIVIVPTTIGNMSGLNCTVPAPGALEITLPCAATYVEMILTHQSMPGSQSNTPPRLLAFNSKGEQVGVMTIVNPERQPEIVRFEGSDLKRIRIVRSGTVPYLHTLCFRCPETVAAVTAIGYDAKNRTTEPAGNKGNVIEVNGANLTRVELTSTAGVCLLKICALFGPDPKEVARRQEMSKHLKSEVVHWEQAGEVLEPYSTYRLKIDTSIVAYGEGELSGTKNLNQSEYAFFRTEGPPGLTKLSTPSGGDSKTFESRLENLVRYVRQTTPATIPALGEKPVMAKPFYRAYDIGIEFNEDYVDLMYRISGRDLALYLYDNNNRPVRDAEGRLLIQGGDWGGIEDLTLNEGEQRWLSLGDPTKPCRPVIDQTKIFRDKKLSSAVAGRVLDPDTVYDARLIPLLLHEGFRSYALTTPVSGPAGKLGRWAVHDKGTTNSPSAWEVRETGLPVSRYVIQTSGIKGSNAADPIKPGTMLLLGKDLALDPALDPALEPAFTGQPVNWTDYRLSVSLRASGNGAIGVIFRYHDANNYLRLLLDRAGQVRRLDGLKNGTHVIYAEDVFAYQPNQDYLITVEAIGPGIRVYQDSALIFEKTLVFAQTGEPLANGAIGLYCHNNPGARFNDVRVDDFRQTANPVYRFQFTSSLYANFFHHLHSYLDETWLAVVPDAPELHQAMTKAASPNAPHTDGEARAYEVIASAVLGQAARQNPPEVQVTRAQINQGAHAFILQSPEPIEWSRTEISFSRADFSLSQPTLPGDLKLVAATFRPNAKDIDAVSLLVRAATNLTGYRIESRLLTWQIGRRNPSNASQSGTQNRPIEGAWTDFHTFTTESIVPTGTVVTVPSGSTAPLTPVVSPGGGIGIPKPILLPTRSVFGVEFRIAAPDGRVGHTRRFVPDSHYSPIPVSVLRKADGTGLALVQLDAAMLDKQFVAGHYRLKLTYRRNNRVADSASRILSQVGSEESEDVAIDIPWQTR